MNLSNNCATLLGGPECSKPTHSCSHDATIILPWDIQGLQLGHTLTNTVKLLAICKLRAITV